MSTLTDRLQEADPLHHEPPQPAHERNRLRQAVVTAAADVASASARSLQPRFALVVAVTLMAIATAATGAWLWSRGTSLQAAVRFEVRLAEDGPAASLQEARISGSDRVVYLHPAVVVSNSDIAQSHVIPGDRLSRFGIAVEFNEAGAERMRQATANHVGKPVAILIDGEVVAAPRLRGPISTSAMISGNFTETDAQRIVNGMSVR